MIKIVSYHRPESLDDALDLMASRELVPIAGGTDLIPQMRDGEPRALIDTRRLGLDYVRLTDGTIEIGACVTHATLCHDRNVRTLLPLLFVATGTIGSAQIRNRGTIGGNIVNASPSADTVPVLLNHDAQVVLASKGSTRRIKLEDFIRKPYSTDRKPGELLCSVVCGKSGAVPGAKTGSCFLKLGRRNSMNISRMSLAVSLTAGADGKLASACVSAGAVFPVARRIRELEHMLSGQIVSQKLLEDAGTLVADLLVAETGVRWSTPYKIPVLKGLLERALHRAARDCGIEIA